MKILHSDKDQQILFVYMWSEACNKSKMAAAI